MNAARGGIVDEAALAEAISEGRVGGAALDVFANEPPGQSALLDLDEVVVTPHLGASTREAQDKAGVAIAEQVVLALEGELVPFAVNLPTTEADDVVRPFVALAERLGASSPPWPGSCPPSWRSGTRVYWLATTRGCSPWPRKRACSPW